MRLAAAGALAGIAILLAGCAAPAPQAHSKSMHDLALLPGLGDEPGAKVSHIDGVALDGGHGTVGLHPSDEPSGMNSSIGVWLSPGRHLIKAQYVRNIVGGISFARGDVSVTLAAGHTYMVHPIVDSDFAKVYFSVVDYGKSFPIRCLPWSISIAKQSNESVKRVRFTHADILACRERSSP